MRMTPIASSSSGNCTYLGSDQTHILVDAGISCKRICDGLLGVDLSLSDLNGIFITHEHSDHIQGLKVLLKKKPLPVFGTKKTLEAILQADSKHELNPELFHSIVPDQDFSLGDLSICPFHNQHDAADPVGYRISCGKRSAAIATDLGTFSQYTLDHLIGTDALLVESNHDVRMLEAGSYPYVLKRRILSDYGHLSNDRCGELLCALLAANPSQKGIYLGHLSKENNYEDLAYETVCCSITTSDLPYDGHDIPLFVARKDQPSKTIEF